MSTIQLSLLGDCVIEIDGSQVTPASTHLFALLLLLTLEHDRLLSRQELQRYLFAVDADSRLAAHSLRQLLYRLRRMGLHFDDRPSGMRLIQVTIVDHLSHLRNINSRDIDTLSDALVFFCRLTHHDFQMPSWSGCLVSVTVWMVTFATCCLPR